MLPKSIEEEEDAEKSWTGSDKVWLVHKSGFSSGAVSKSKDSVVEDEEQEESGEVDVKLDHGGQVIEKIDGSSVEKVCCFCDVCNVCVCAFFKKFFFKDIDWRYCTVIVIRLT